MNSTSTILWSFGIWSKLERWKISTSECLTSWSKKEKKKSCFDVSSLFLPDNNEPFIDCAMKSGQLTTGDDLLSGWIEKKHQSTSQGQTCKKKGVLVKFGGLLLALSTISFWIPEKPLHTSSMLSTSARCIKSCKACGQRWSTERAQFFSMMTPEHRLHSQHFKRWVNGAMKFCFLPSHSPDFLATDYHFFKHLDNFLQRKCLYNQ